MNSLASLITFFALGSSSAFAMTLESTKVQTYDGLSLNAFWSVPDTAPIGAVLVIQGSGNVAADGDVSGPLLGTGYQGKPAKLSQDMANALAAVGIVSLRFDKRGVTDPTQLPNQTLPFMKKDAESALAMIQARYPGLNVGVVGLSEGAFIATLIAGEIPVKSLFLFSLPTRPIDEVFSYQFMGWPTGLLLSHFDPTGKGVITGDQFTAANLTLLPLAGVPWSAIDANKDGVIEEGTELFPAYQSFYQSVRGLLATPAFSYWYASYLPLPSFAQIGGAVQSKSIFIYQAMDDAQIRWNWVFEDSIFFSVKPTIHLFNGLGHCFSPMSGVMGEVKTSGPMADEVLQAFTADVLTGLK